MEGLRAINREYLDSDLEIERIRYSNGIREIIYRNGCVISELAKNPNNEDRIEYANNCTIYHHKDGDTIFVYDDDKKDNAKTKVKKR